MEAPSFIHSYFRGAAPSAKTENVAFWPGKTETDVGCVTMLKVFEVETTVRVAVLLVTEPAPLLTATE
jgi:hypothetical protein